MGTRLGGLGLAVVVSLSTGGCALMSARAPSNSLAAGEVPSCNPGKGAVAVDVLVTVIFGVGLLAAAADGEGGIAAGLSVGAVAYGGSAAYGSSTANRCQRAIATAEQVRRDQMAWQAVDAAAGTDATPVKAPVKAPVEAPVAGSGSDPDPDPDPDPEDADADANADDGAGGDGRWRDFWREVAR